VGDGVTVVHGEAGWPGLGVTLLHGLAPNIDIGGRFTFDYSYEGMVNNVFTGTKLQAVLRFKLLDLNVVKVGMSIEPGVLVYFPDSATTIAGLALPINFVMGFPITSNLLINVGLDFPLWVTFAGYSSFNTTIAFGGGFEYFINSNLEFTFDLRLGAVIEGTAFPANSADAQFAIPRAFIGLAYKL
jgi:hypothetical protein